MPRHSLHPQLLPISSFYRIMIVTGFWHRNYVWLKCADFSEDQLSSEQMSYKIFIFYSWPKFPYSVRVKIKVEVNFRVRSNLTCLGKSVIKSTILNGFLWFLDMLSFKSCFFQSCKNCGQKCPWRVPGVFFWGHPVFQLNYWAQSLDVSTYH